VEHEPLVQLATLGSGPGLHTMTHVLQTQTFDALKFTFLTKDDQGL
jgi:hypothetical protein